MKKNIYVNLLINVIVRKIWIILLCAIIFGGVGYLESIFSSKTLDTSASSNIYIGHSSKSEYRQNLDLGIQDVIEIAKSRNVLAKAIKKLDLNMSVDELSSKYRVENITNTRMIKLSIKDKNRKNAEKITSTIQEIVIKRINKVDKNTKVVVIEDARLSESQTEKQNNFMKKGMFAGAVIGFLIIIVLYRKQFIIENNS